MTGDMNPPVLDADRTASDTIDHPTTPDLRRGQSPTDRQ